MESIIVTAVKYNFSFLPFRSMAEGPIIHTQSLFHGIYTANLASNLLYFLFDSFAR